MESEPITADWRRALKLLAGDNDAHANLRGFAVRALSDHGEFVVDSEMEKHGLTFNPGGFLRRVR